MTNHRRHQKKDVQNELLFQDDLFGSAGPDIDDLFADSEEDDREVPDRVESRNDDIRLERMKCVVSKYLQKQVSVLNMSRHSYPIHRIPIENTPDHGSRPSLEIFIVVHDSQKESIEYVRSNTDYSKACAMLIRLVNNVPLLDSPEASTCGLYQAIIKAQNMWNSFGVDLKPAPEKINKDKKKKINGRFLHHLQNDSIIEENTALYIPTFELCDTRQMSKYLTDNDATHGLFQATKNYDSDDSKAKDTGVTRGKQQKSLLSIGQRLGNVLVIAHLHNANQQDIPFPSLTKVKSYSTLHELAVCT